MLFDLYGGFAVEGDRDGSLRLSAIAQFAADLGLTGVAARAAAARLAQDGWLLTERHGRESVYRLTKRGRSLVEEGRQRIFAPPQPDWDGSWCMVALSVPESRREVRDRLRKELSWLGFGSPSSALHVSPRDHTAQVRRRAEELGASDLVQVYTARLRWPAEPRELVERAWAPLDAVNLRYAGFINRFSRELARTRTDLAAGSFPDRAAFVQRFTLANQFRKCLYNDPELPEELLPAAWWGLTARRLFLEFHQLVTPPALRYFDAVAAGQGSSSRPAPRGRRTRSAA